MKKTVERMRGEIMYSLWQEQGLPYLEIAEIMNITQHRTEDIIQNFGYKIEKNRWKIK